MAWTAGHEIKYWRKTGIDKGSNIYSNYCKAFDLDEYDFSGRKILDIGCGPFGGCFCHHGELDVTPMDILADEYNKIGVSKRQIAYGDLSQNLPVENDKFDFVISTNAIDHIPDVNHGFTEIRRVMVPGGIFFLHVHLRTRKELNKAHVHVLNRKIVKKMAMRNQFEVLRAKEDSDWVNDRQDRRAAYLTLRKL